MKDIKITKDNYKELFECAGFEKEGVNAFYKNSNAEVAGEKVRIQLVPIPNGNGFDILTTLINDGFIFSLPKVSRSTSELDRVLFPFLYKPLVWEKKWDFESVFERHVAGYKSLIDIDKEAVKEQDFTHIDPRVQAFSRLLFVMEELNKEYEGSERTLGEVYIEDNKIKEDVCLRRSDINCGIWVLNNSKALYLFTRDNEADLKTFFNI